MADPAHLEIAEKGAKAIARWRRSHPGKSMGLTGADFTLPAATRTYLWQLMTQYLEIGDSMGGVCYGIHA